MNELVDLQMLPRKDPEQIELAPDANSLDLLRAVYRNNELPLHTRMRAAMAALKHEVPALLATAIVNERDFATLLDQRIDKLRKMEQQAKLNDARPTNGGNDTASETAAPELLISTKPAVAANNADAFEAPAKPPLPDPLARLYSNRFRRRF